MDRIGVHLEDRVRVHSVDKIYSVGEIYSVGGVHLVKYT